MMFSDDEVRDLLLMLKEAKGYSCQQLMKRNGLNAETLKQEVSDNIHDHREVARVAEVIGMAALCWAEDKFRIDDYKGDGDE